MLTFLHKHLNSPNASASIIIPILCLGWRRPRGLGICRDTDCIPSLLPPSILQVLYRFLYFTLNALESPRKPGWYVYISY